MVKNVIILSVLCFIAGAGADRIYSYVQQSKLVTGYTERLAVLQRIATERHEQYEKGQRELEAGIAQSRQLVSAARDAVERTARKMDEATERLSRDAKNIRTAITVVGELYNGVKELEDYFNGLYTDSRWLGNVVTVEVDEMNQLDIYLNKEKVE